MLFVLLPLVVWGGAVYQAIKKRESKPESFQWVVRWLRQDKFGLFYLQALGRLSDRVGSWIGDRQQFVAVGVGQPKGWTGKWFGVNPFTAESYEKCLKLAFIYPILSFFIAWAMGGDFSG